MRCDAGSVRAFSLLAHPFNRRDSPPPPRWWSEAEPPETRINTEPPPLRGERNQACVARAPAGAPVVLKRCSGGSASLHNRLMAFVPSGRPLGSRCMALFQLDPECIAARVRAAGGTAHVPTLTESITRGVLGFTCVSIAGFLPWPIFELWFRGLGEMHLYVACTAVFIGLSGVCLHKLILGPGSLSRFYKLFALAFLAYAAALGGGLYDAAQRSEERRSGEHRWPSSRHCSDGCDPVSEFRRAAPDARSHRLALCAEYTWLLRRRLDDGKADRYASLRSNAVVGRRLWDRLRRGTRRRLSPLPEHAPRAASWMIRQMPLPCRWFVFSAKGAFHTSLGQRPGPAFQTRQR